MGDDQMRARRNRPIGTTARQRAWLQSAQAAEQRRMAAQQAKAQRRHAPKCGAAKKSGNRQPCRNLALENGRCRLHGGATPKGAKWHQVQMPGRGAPIGKLEKKLREIERRRQKQAARVAAMTPEQKQRYDAWHRAHRPGTAAQREARRRDREASAMFAVARAAPTGPEMDKLAAAIAELQARKALLLARIAAPTPTKGTDR